MLERADRLSDKAGTLCKKAGEAQQYHEALGQVGRGMRVSKEFQHTDSKADDVEIIDSETEQKED